MAIQKEMYQKPASLETEQIITSKTQDLNVVQYATIPGIRGMQFGREIFSATLKFKDLMKFLQVFPEVQRTASGRKIGSIKNYILSGIEDKTNLRFFSAITVTARGHVFYDSTTNHIAIDTVSSKLSVNDGQHRFYGVQAAIEELERRMAKAKSKAIFELNERYANELKEMVIPVVLFNNISEDIEKQLFHDINNLSSKPSRSATIRLSQTDLFSKLAREVSEENHYLLKYGVEYNKMSIHKANLNTILLTTIYNFCRGLFHQELVANSDFLTEKNYESSKAYVHEVLNKMFKTLPQDLHVKNKYITSKAFAFRGICQFIYESTNDMTITDEEIYEAIGKVNWLEDISYWSAYGAGQTKTGAIQFPSNGQGGIIAAKIACREALGDIQFAHKSNF